MTYTAFDDLNDATLQIPSGVPGKNLEVDCLFQEMRGTRLSIECSVPVSTSTAVSVKHEDALYLGEVIKAAGVNGKWLLEINVEHILSGLSSLLALREQLMSEKTVSPFAAIPAGTRN